MAKEAAREVMDLIYEHMFTYNLNMLTTFHPVLSEYILKNKTPFYYKKPMKQEYFVSKEFSSVLPANYTLEFQDGDGDCAFT